MREVAPGDLIFSFADTFIRAIGIAKSHCYECPKPIEFGSVGMYWNMVGWRIDVEYTTIGNPIRPMNHIEILRPLLPTRYSPLRDNGHGIQSVYLTAVPEPLAMALVGLIGYEARRTVDLGSAFVRDSATSERPAQALAEWEDHVRSEIQRDISIPETTRTQLVLARRGQGQFRDAVSRIESHCRVTGVNRTEHLIASHCKPWRDSDNHERLDGENGLLLTPSIDHLFDRGFISFENNGELIVSSVAHIPSLTRMGVPAGSKYNAGSFSEGQRRYLEYHRESVFLQAVRR